MREVAGDASRLACPPPPRADAPVANPLWQLDGVCLGDSRSPRLAGVTLTLRAGTTAVLGPSGSGKTSLLDVLVGFARPQRGTVRAAPPRTTMLAWVPADGGLWPHLDARRHLLLVHPHGGATAAADAERWLAAFDLEARAGARPAQLSHGERQRLSLARALCTGARVLVLDEPLAHVDALATARYVDLLRAHVADGGRSLVLATHDPRAALALAEHAVVMRQGEVAFAGTIADLYERPPTPWLAACLGDATWLSAAEARAWLDMSGVPASGAAFRPERLELLADPRGALHVERSRALGATTETTVQPFAAGAEPATPVRIVHHGPPLAPATRATLRLDPWRSLATFVLLALVLLTGCARDVRELTVASVHHHAMPPAGITVPAPRAVAPGAGGEWLVLDTAGRVLVFDREGALRRQWSMPAHDVGKPEGICRLADGRIVVADTHYHRLVFFDGDGHVLSCLGERGTGPLQFLYPVRVVQDPHGFLYVAEYGGNDRVQKLTPAGELVLAFGRPGTGPGELQRPSGLCWHDGSVFVADAMNRRVLEFRDDGRFVRALPDEAASGVLDLPYDVTVTADGRLLVVEYGGGCVTALSRDGEVLGRFGSTGTGARQLATPWGLGLVAARCLVVADTGNRRLVEVRW